MRARILLAVVLLAAANVCLAAKVGLKEKSYTYDEAALAPVDETLKLALLDGGWTLLEASPGHVVAKTFVRLKHYAKVDIVYASGSLHIKLLESENLDVESCEFYEGSKRYRGTCVNPHYYQWLDELVASLPAAHAKVLATAAAGVSAPADAAATNPVRAVSTFVFEALLTGADDDVVTAARGLGPNPPEHLRDLAAQVLYDNCSRGGPLGEDSLSWLAKTLARSGTVRYRGVVEKCAAIPSDKIEKWNAIALQAMTGPGTAYVPGAVDVAAVRAHLGEVMRAAHEQRRTEAFYGASLGTPAGRLFEALGYPDRIMSTGNFKRSNPDVPDVPYGWALAQYDGAGSLFLDATSASAPDWELIAVTHAPTLDALPAERRVMAVRQLMQGVKEPGAVQMSVAALRRVKIRDPASLDVIAQSLSDLRAGDNTTLAEALVYLCEVLGRSGNGRYRNVLEDIAATAGAARVRLQAVDESRRLPAGDKAPFVPVTAAAGAKAG